MRWTLLVLVSAVCFVPGTVHGQGKLTEQKARDELEKRGISVYPHDRFAPGSEMAHIRLTDAETLRSIGLLGQIRSVVGIYLTIDEKKHTQEALARIAEWRGLLSVHLNADRLTDAEFQNVLGFKQLEELSLNYADISDTQIGELQALKNWKYLKRLHVVHSSVSAKALDELKRALPKVEVEFEHVMALLPISPKEDPLVKLQKAKANAAIAELNCVRKDIRRGIRTPGDLNSLNASQRLVEAALALDDPKLVTRVVDEHVSSMAIAWKEAENRLKAGGLDPASYHRVQYYYLESQILQLRVKEQLKAK